MSGLTRRTRLKASREHEWEDEGRNEWRCTRCMARRWSPTEPDADVFPCSGLRRSGLQRNKRVNPVSETNSGREHQKDEAVYGHYFRWAADRRCCGCGAYPCVPHHLTSVGAGGKDAENLLDVCYACHTQIHTEGLSSWEADCGIDASEQASELWADYKEQGNG